MKRRPKQRGKSHPDSMGTGLQVFRLEKGLISSTSRMTLERMLISNRLRR